MFSHHHSRVVELAVDQWLLHGQAGGSDCSLQTYLHLAMPAGFVIGPSIRESRSPMGAQDLSVSA